MSPDTANPMLLLRHHNMHYRVRLQLGEARLPREQEPLVFHPLQESTM